MRRSGSFDLGLARFRTNGIINFALQGQEVLPHIVPQAVTIVESVPCLSRLSSGSGHVTS